MCLYSSSLLLPVGSLTPTACKICFHTDQFSFLHSQNSISDGLKGKKRKEKAAARGVVASSWLCARRAPSGEVQRGERCITWQCLSGRWLQGEERNQLLTILGE